ncbi:MAG TPA: hypothetical protein VFV66_17730 [Nonomuraea sp.]|nr:hypothetical protein [Nonomuraea sp.]
MSATFRGVATATSSGEAELLDAAGDALAGLGFGFATAKDNVCLLADAYLTVGAQRSRRGHAVTRVLPGPRRRTPPRGRQSCIPV